jgi:hypothetical protein
MNQHVETRCNLRSRAGIWGLPIPDDIISLPQKVSGIEVKIEVWQYGTVAQILHIGPFSIEMPMIQRLQNFIAGNGYEIAGVHEEGISRRPRQRFRRPQFVTRLEKSK